jgi:hypothetical protein
MVTLTRRVIRNCERARENFLRRLLSRLTDVEDVESWENTFEALERLGLEGIFADNMEAFTAFLARPTRANFDAWRTAIHDGMEENGGVIDDWSMSGLMFAILFQPYRDFDIADDTVPVEPHQSVDLVSDMPLGDTGDAFLTAPALATVVLGLVQCCDQTPGIAHVAEMLLNEAVKREEREGEEG